MKYEGDNVIALRNYDSWSEILLIDVVTGEKKFIKRTKNIKIKGVYKTCSSEQISKTQGIILFFKKEDKLYFNANGIEYCLQDKNCSVYFERSGCNNIFSIKVLDKTVFSFTYSSVCFEAINSQDFDFNQDREEDQDFYLFVYNVMQDKERQHRIYAEN